jgi:hypothetical protein
MDENLPKSYPRVDVEISQADIDTGVRAVSGHCVIAEALRRQGLTRVEVDLQTISFTNIKRGVRVTYLTPRVAQQHLIAFDLAESVLRPFRFRLQGPIRIRPGGKGAGGSMKSTGTAVQDRAERMADLTAKETAGTLASRERAALTKMRDTDAAGGPAARRPTRPTGDPVELDHPRRRAPIVGGQRAEPAAALSNRKGRVRRYGMKAVETDPLTEQ